MRGWDDVVDDAGAAARHAPDQRERRGRAVGLWAVGCGEVEWVPLSLLQLPPQHPPTSERTTKGPVVPPQISLFPSPHPAHTLRSCLLIATPPHPCCHHPLISLAHFPPLSSPPSSTPSSLCPRFLSRQGTRKINSCLASLVELLGAHQRWCCIPSLLSCGGV